MHAKINSDRHSGSKEAHRGHEVLGIHIVKMNPAPRTSAFALVFPKLAIYVFYVMHACVTLDYRPTEKGLETPQIYPGIDVTTRN